MKGVDREVPIADFARLFMPSGIMDKFFKDNLAAYVDQSKAQWTWRLDSVRGARPVARHLAAVPAGVAKFATPSSRTGGNMPSFTMAVTPLTLSGDAATAKFEINGTAVVSQQGVNSPTNVNWPGGGVARTAITLGGGGGGFFGGGFFSQPTIVAKDGPWSFFKMLDSGTVLRQGDKIIASFVVGGKEVSYQFNVGSLLNPLDLPALRNFRCPAGI